jgi:5-methylcytosine-specific restriction protein B
MSPVIAAYDAWAAQCLVGDGSALSGDSLWTPDHIAEVRRAFVEHPDLGQDDFMTKLKNQMKQASPGAKQLMAEMLWALLLFPSNVKPATKRGHVRDIWELSGKELNEGHPLLSDDVLQGIGSGGPGFNNHRWRELVFLIECATSLKQKDPPERKQILGEYDAFMSWMDTVPQQGRRQLRLMWRFFAFPDRVERMSSSGDRLAVLQGFDVAPGAELSKWNDRQIDDALFALRNKLEADNPGAILDFYQSPLWERWRTEEADEEEDEGPTSDGQQVGPRVWIEKTKVRGRKDREVGDYALGKMLWSPKRSKNGGDIYRFMREVQRGDLVLHLTDNEGFTGTSVIDSEATEFNGLPDTEWSDRPSYQIRLRDFEELDPPLLRVTFFSPPYVGRLTSLIDRGQQNLFYNKEPSLNQGAYLTPASPDLVEILQDAYRTVSDKPLLPLPQARQEVPPAAVPEAREDLVVISASLAAALHGSHLHFGPGHDSLVRAFVASLAAKRFVILTGLSGSGKTQIAIKFGQWLGTGRYKVVAVRPDWTGPDALFGYEDALRRSKDGRQGWNVPEVLEFMLSAARDPQMPYALILDEMNLAHVERYFADALSGIETSEPCLPNLVRGPDGIWVQVLTPAPKLAFPANLFVIGTVNVDETTYLFSPKVLDRANTFEFRVDASGLSPVARKPVDIGAGEPGLVRGLLAIARREGWHLDNPPSWLDAFTTHLNTVHRLLGESSLEFGHRVYYEAVRFAALYYGAGEQSMEAALDRQVLQKLLPRIHGSRKRVEAALCALGKFCVDLTFTAGSASPGASAVFDVSNADLAASRLPMSLGKVQRMMRTLRANQFTSFTD